MDVNFKKFPHRFLLLSSLSSVPKTQDKRVSSSIKLSPRFATVSPCPSDAVDQTLLRFLSEVDDRLSLVMHAGAPGGTADALRAYRYD